ncbi:MAG TPA: thiamine pyrophosphate-dependent enzyme, partial [Thermodesulfobacteriota bacterium]|nr:thiamine pyrophosphate-dependent enzyme [Thermodesulfobacteriota bacterium]
GALPKTRRQAKFDTSAPFQYIPVVPKHGRSHDRLAKIRERFESAPFNAYDGPDRPDLMIVTSGSGAAYTREALSLMGVEDRVGILKLGTTWPFPEGLIARHLPKAQKILFAEETDPFLESNIKEMSADLTLSLEISPRNFYGKRSGHMPATGELNTDRIINAVARILGAPYTPRDPAYARRVREIVKEHAPERVLSFCPGCPHRASLWTIKNALSLDSRDGFLTGDIGCYALARTASGFSLSKTSGAMGSGTGLACGFGKLGQFGLDQPAVSVCGDSTFFHAAIPALVNAQYSGSNFVMCILDNGATAMTGFQPHPGVGRNAMGEPGPAVDIESICRSLKIHVEVSDPFDLKRTREALNGLLEEKGVKVLILRQSCALQRLKGEKPPYRVRIDPETCLGDGCGCNRVCTRVFRCPGILWDVDAGKSKIDEVICVGCGVCAEICPNSAIVREEAR